MAIKIPSKNIYEMNNPKIRDNVIDNVSVEQTVVTPNNEYEVNVFSEELNKNTTETKQESSNSATNLDNFTNGYPLIASAVKIVDEYAKIDIKIKKLKENSLISRLYNSKSELTNESITKIEKVFDEVVYNLSEIDDGFSFTIYDNVIQNSSFNVNLENINEIKSSKRINNPTSKIATFEFSNTADYSNINRIFFGGNIQYELGNLDVENEQSNQNTIHSITQSPFYDNRSANSSISIETQEQDLSSLTISEDDDYFYVQSEDKGFLTKRIYYAFMSGVYTKDLENGTHSFPCNVLKVEQKAVSAIMTIYGDTIGIDLTNGSILCGSGTKPHSLSGNELLQDSATRNSSQLATWLGSDILTQYEKGKETATLLCDIADYYDESGEKAIDIKTDYNMCFKLHNEVIPYVFGADGQDKPMSKYQDGSPKVFEVVGSNIIYDGAVWQELTLLEKQKTNS